MRAELENHLPAVEAHVRTLTVGRQRLLEGDGFVRGKELLHVCCKARVTSRHGSDGLRVHHGGLTRDSNLNLHATHIPHHLADDCSARHHARARQKRLADELAHRRFLRRDHAREVGHVRLCDGGPSGSVVIILASARGGACDARTCLEGQDAVEDLNWILDQQLCLLSQLLYAVHHLADSALVEHGLVGHRIEDDEQVAEVRRGSFMGLRVAHELCLHQELLSIEGLAIDGDALCLQEGGELLVCECADLALPLPVRLAKARAEGLVVGHALELDEILRLSHPAHGDLAHVELRRDVPLKGEHVVEVLLVLVDDHHLGQGDLEALLLAVAARAAELDDRLHGRHSALDGRVAGLLEHGGHHAVVHRGLALRLGQGGHERLVEVLGEEGREGSHELGQQHQHLVERAQCPLAVLHGRLLRLALEARTVELDVPVGELLDEAEDVRYRGVEAVGLHLRAHVGDEGVRRGNNPAVHQVGRGHGELDVRLEGTNCRPLLQLEAARRLGEEAEGVVPGQKHVAGDTLDSRLGEAQGLRAHHRRVDQIEPERVRPVLVDDVDGVGVVLQALGHLAAVLCEHETVDDQVLEGRLV
mmetsp:Transcript_16290/g.43906  ORF Transcript_16290/g.43906 Transcript_16290/m.43906 type:complete len:589 (-) Transcript_16290:4-1770(-)